MKYCSFNLVISFPCHKISIYFSMTDAHFWKILNTWFLFCYSACATRLISSPKLQRVEIFTPPFVNIANTSKCIINGNALSVIMWRVFIIPFEWGRAYSQRLRWRAPRACSCTPSCVCGTVFKSSLCCIAYYVFRAQFSSYWKCSTPALSRPGVARQAFKNWGKEHVVGAWFEWLAW